MAEDPASMAEDPASVEEAVRVILRHCGEDPEREGLARTPTRVAKAFAFLTRGYGEEKE